MAKKTTQRKSIDSIFDDNSFGDEESVTTLRLSEIEPNKNQPRKNFDSEALKQLAESIRQSGLIQPLLVRALADGRYQIVAGERRWRACKMAGLSEVPVFIRDLSDIEAQQLALIENLQRENLSPIEEAMGYKELIDNYSMTQDELAKIVGKARSSITNSIRLLSLPKDVKAMCDSGELSGGHCKVLLGLDTKAKQSEIAKRAVEKQLSVRELERIVKAEMSEKKEKKEKKKDSFYTEAEISLSNVLKTKVNITSGRKKNTLEIEFYSKEELTEIINRLAEQER